MLHCTQYTKMYLDLYLHTTGNYNNDDVKQFIDIQTCASKDLRSGFEGHYVVEISWTPHLTHGMYTHVSSYKLFYYYHIPYEHKFWLGF